MRAGRTMLASACSRSGYGACIGLGLIALAGIVVGSRPAAADRISNPIAVFAALDKVTARISTLEIPIGQTAEFGSLKVTPQVCYTRSPLEPPKTTSFVQVSETKLDGTEEMIFSGWMFAQSPGLNAVEHPVFDVWLSDCAGEGTLEASEAGTDDEQAATNANRKKKRPVRR